MIARLEPLRERYDAILLDLDGTLLDDASLLSERTCRAVRHLVHAGFEVMISTGRSVVGAEFARRRLELDTALVAYNGAWIGQPGSVPWRHASIPDHLLPDVERPESMACFSYRHNSGKKYSLRRSHPHYDRVADWYTQAVCVEDPGELPDRDLMRVSCFFDDASVAEDAWGLVTDATRRVLSCQSYALSIFPEFRDADLILSEIEIRSRGKAEVYDYLESERGIPAHRVIAVGDHVNDISMLRGAGLGVAMGNAVPRLLDCADLVIGSNDEDGLAAWIEAGAPLDGAFQGGEEDV